MKKFLSCFVLLAMMSPAQALCLRQQDVVSTTSQDGRNLVFKLRDGRTLVNQLKSSCSDLRFNGFVWILRGDNSICENVQTLQTLNTGQVCALGAFQETKMPVKAR